MKTSLIKKTARTFFLVQAVMLVTSCSNFLNIDNYFDDEFNIDSVFTNARYMEAYMWGAAAMFPDEAQTIRNGYTPGPMATDEGFNGLTGSGTANIYHGMDFANGKITQDFLGDGSPNLNQWGKYYKIIRKCNSILQNLDHQSAFLTFINLIFLCHNVFALNVHKESRFHAANIAFLFESHK